MKYFQWLRDIPYWFIRMRRRFATLAMGAAACFVLFHVVFGANGLAIYIKKRDENRQLQKQVLEMQEQNQKLEQNINALKHDPKAIEKEAREQLKYARPGEVIYTLPDTKNNKPATQTAVADPANGTTAPNATATNVTTQNPKK